MVKDMNQNQEVETEVVDAEVNTANETQQSEQEQAASDNVSEQTSVDADNVSDMTDWRDKYMRLSAEFDNYRKRTLREKMDLIATGGEDVIKSLLPVLDDMDRALAAVSTATDIDAIRMGVELIALKLRDTMKSRGVNEIEALGAELDTDFHEAVARFPKEGESGKIIDVVQKGYKFKDKVIRHAKVVVGE